MASDYEIQDLLDDVRTSSEPINQLHSPPLARKSLLPGDDGRDASRFASFRTEINSTLFGDDGGLV